MKAVEMNNLSKIYASGKKALDHVSLSLNKGEVFGFLGPNGAGKTTTVKLLNGMLASSEGSCRVFGIDPEKEPVKIHALAGVVTEHAQMYDNLTGLQNLVFYGEVFGVTAGESEKRAKSLLQQLKLSEAENQKLSSYSTGMRQRLSLARALIHHPKILFLDEPTSGLDPESAHNVNQMILSLSRKEGVTVFLCTHQLRYAEEICTRYGLLDKGELLISGDLRELRLSVLSGIRLKIKASHIPSDIFCRKVGEQEFEAELQSQEEIPPVIRRIVEEGGDIWHVSAKQPSLEDIYFQLTSNRKGAK